MAKNDLDRITRGVLGDIDPEPAAKESQKGTGDANAAEAKPKSEALVEDSASRIPNPASQIPT